MPRAGAAAALAAAEAAGPFFTLQAATSGPARAWRPFAELTDRPAVLQERIDAVRATLADRAGLAPAAVPARAATSLAHLGLVARLVSPVLGAGLLGGVVPDLDAAALLWRAEIGGPVPLALPDPVGEPVERDDPAALSRAVAGALAAGPAAQLTEAAAAVGRVSRTVLWGNVASAVAGALTMLVRAVPDRAAVAAAVGARLVGSAPLAGAGHFAATPPGAPPAFVRASCCLCYRVPGGGLCADCVLAHRRPVR